jgi:putative membrane protein
VLILFSVFCFAAAVWREVFPAVPPPAPDTRRIPSLCFYAIDTCLAAVALHALASIWIAG